MKGVEITNVNFNLDRSVCLFNLRIQHGLQHNDFVPVRLIINM